MPTSSSLPIARLLSLIALTLLLVGCAQAQQSPGEKLKQSVLSFHTDLRWQRFDSAAGFVPATQRGDFLSYYEGSRKDLKITEFEVVRVEIPPKKNTAHVVVMIQWHRLPSTTIKTSWLQETWTYLEKRGMWVVTDQTVHDEDPAQHQAAATLQPAALSPSPEPR